MDRRKKGKWEYVVQSVDHALDILESFDYRTESLGVTELSHRLNLHKNNVFRLLATLECRGYIEQDQKTGNYRLGIKTFEVANVFLHHLGLSRQARPILKDMVDKCNETVYLTILDGAEVVYVLMQETTHTVRIVPRVGRRLPAYCTASGKAQLAFESEDRLDPILREHPLRRFTERTIVDVEELKEHLREVARRGYAIDDEELEEGVRCVAAPVRDYSHKVVAGATVVGPVARFSTERIENELVPLVREAAARISQRLGFEVRTAAAN